MKGTNMQTIKTKLSKKAILELLAKREQNAWNEYQLYQREGLVNLAAMAKTEWHEAYRIINEIKEAA